MRAEAAGSKRRCSRGSKERVLQSRKQRVLRPHTWPRWTMPRAQSSRFAARRTSRCPQVDQSSPRPSCSPLTWTRTLPSSARGKAAVCERKGRGQIEKRCRQARTRDLAGSAKQNTKGSPSSTAHATTPPFSRALHRPPAPAPTALRAASR